MCSSFISYRAHQNISQIVQWNTGAGTATIAAAAARSIPTGDGYLIPCPCPGHGKGRGDLNPSLHIRDGEHRLLVRCFAGCEPAEILKALGASPTRAAPAQPAPNASTAAPQSR